MSILKVKKQADLVDELQLFDDDPFTVLVRALTQSQKEQLYDSTTREQRGFGGVRERVQDPKLWNDLAPDAYVAGWEKLSPATLLRLNVFVEEAPPTDGDGFIPYSADVSRELWREADRLKFSTRIIGHSLDMGENRAKAETLKKRGSRPSSES